MRENYQKRQEEILRELQVTRESGLTSSEAERRRQEYGKNVFEKQKSRS